MTGTAIDAIQDAAAALNAATLAFNALNADIAAEALAAQANATTVVNNFLTRPLQQTYYVDPVNGSDANNGTSYATAFKTLDATIAVSSSPTLGNQSALVLLFGNVTLQRRYTYSGNLVIWGAQPANTPLGFTFARRTLSFLGLATNSPDPNLGVMSAGINFTGAASLTISSCDIQLPAVAAAVPGYYDCPFIAAAELAVFISTFTMTVADSTARALIASFVDGNTGALTGHILASLAPTFGAGAAGHLFRGVAAGGNPNTLFNYQTNVTAA